MIVANGVPRPPRIDVYSRTDPTIILLTTNKNTRDVHTCTRSCTAVLSSDYLLLYLRASIRHGQTHLSACLNRALLILATSYRLLACGFARQPNRDALRLPTEPRQMFGGSGGSGSRGAVPPASSPASRARLSRARPLLLLPRGCALARRPSQTKSDAKVLALIF